MKIKVRDRIIWALGAVAVLSAGFLLCRYAFFGLHGMMQWPLILFVFGLVVILIAAISDSRKVMLCTAAGYLAGFALGMTFNWDTFHPERGPGVYTNNNWSIWMFSLLFFIAGGVVWDIVCKRKKRAAYQSLI